MRIDPGDPTAAFNLGNLLRAVGRKVEAEAAYRAATKSDPGFAEAWYNLADMLDDQSQPTRPSLASSARSRPTRTTPMRSSISACCTSATSGTRMRPICWRRYLALDNALGMGGAREAGVEILRDADRASS